MEKHPRRILKAIKSSGVGLVVGFVLAPGFVSASAQVLPQDGCRFKASGPLKVSTIADSIHVETEAMVLAREEAKKTCHLYGWSQCENSPKFSKIVSEFVSSQDLFKVQYEAEIESLDCFQTAQSVHQREDLELDQGKYRIKASSRYKMDQLRESSRSLRAARGLKRYDDHCRSPEGDPTILEAGDFGAASSSPVWHQQSRNTAIPGDPYGRGHRE